MTGTLNQAKKWYQRKLLWLFVILILLVYFCFVPSRLRISPETTGITEPLTADGRVDYFAAFESMYIDDLSPATNNGQRLLIAACGPRILEMNALLDRIGEWEKVPLNEDAKTWFNNYWIPLCENIYIDPYKKPMFYDKRDFISYMKKYFKEQKEAAGEKYDNENENDVDKLYKELTAGTWKREEHPEASKWLDEYSEVLDYFGMCVRKPHFANWRKKYEDGSLLSVLLPDVQSNRSFATSLRLRICERIGRGDIDGAWHDIMSIKYLSRHYVNENFIVINLVGIAVDAIANDATKLLLIHCQPNEKQLAKFISDLDNLPEFNPKGLTLAFDRLLLFQTIQLFQSKGYLQLLDELDTAPASDLLIVMFRLLARLPYDANIAGKHLTKIWNEIELKNIKHSAINPALRRQYAEQLEKVVGKYSEKIKSTRKVFGISIPNDFYRIPLIRTRSELLAEYIVSYFTSAMQTATLSFDRYDALNEMQRLAIILERYKLANGKYPDKLDDLVPKYIDIVPIDPFTGKATFVYKLSDPAKAESKNDPATTETKTAEAKTTASKTLPYILYSLGPNRKDDNATPFIGTIKDSDVVF
ncbi:MAG: hypothetical protein LBP59_03420 [Planctomycetaceae bacterium]|jgi:hypothetical protein|nr:hypothetical protein [Planctomycetaceae bacterium]